MTLLDSADSLLASVIKDETRRRILAGFAKEKEFKKALLRLRDSMRSGVFKDGSNQFRFDKIIETFDSRNSQDGFHVLHDWDGTADRLNDEIIPVDVLNYIHRTNTGALSRQTVLAVLLDYYLLYVLALLSLRVWDEGNPNENLDRLTELLQNLQGPCGSRQQFAENAETLILIATSHFEPDVTAYERLLEKVKSLNPSNQLRIAFVHAAILGSHLRHGFQGFYGRDIGAMRDDNTPDYPWLCFSLVTLMEAYARAHDGHIHGTERERIVEGLLNGLSPDARAFLGKAPASLAAFEDERARFFGLFRRYKEDLLGEFERHRPSDRNYSPVSFTFNFPHNLLKAIVVDALLRGEPWNLTLNDLLSGIPRLEPLDPLRRRLAETLAGYARSSPEMVRGRPVPAVNYDPRSGLLNFAKTIRIIQESSERD